MARYELGAVYKINSDNGNVYYVRLLEDSNYGVFAPFEGELSEDTLSKIPYRLYLSCNTFAVKRGIWEKVLHSPNSKDIERWQEPQYLANYGNYNPQLFVEQHRVWHKGNLYHYEKDKFINLVKQGLIKKIFNRHEVIPSFLNNYYDGWVNSYILEKVYFENKTQEQKEPALKALREMGFDTTDL